jgi:hypothetical protein
MNNRKFAQINAVQNRDPISAPYRKTGIWGVVAALEAKAYELPRPSPSPNKFPVTLSEAVARYGDESKMIYVLTVSLLLSGAAFPLLLAFAT